MTNAPIIADGLWGRGVPCPYDDVIDVRSPAEHDEDRIPGSINLPVLDDGERAEVGTIYRVEGAFAARKIGAALVSANIARHLRDHFAAKGKDYRPFVYCWRGGQRSASLATVLAHVGRRVTVLRGGYMTYRRHVRDELESRPPLFSYRLLAGATGTAKTRVLHALAARAQVLDLEGLARHRGSVLGRDGPQPTQKCFDSMLLAALDWFDPTEPVWVEAESNRIGDLFVPPALWAKMRTADGVVVRMPTDARVRHLLADYSHLLADGEALKARLRPLATRRGPRQIAQWESFIDAGEWTELVASLLAVHYDPAYEESSRRCSPQVTRSLELEEASPAAIDELAGRLLETSPESTAEESRPLAELRRIAGGRCVDCGALHSACEAVESIVLGFTNAVRCRACLGVRLNVDPAELRQRLDEYIRRRECYRVAWEAAIEMDRLPPAERVSAPVVHEVPPKESGERSWDAGDLGCGELVMGLRTRLDRLRGGAEFRLRATDAAAPEDIPAWCRLCGHVLVAMDHPSYVIRRKGP